jgi:cytochrome d ubiquinol oxidase subunit I
MHFVSTIIVAIGTLVSAFWILSANSWMQTPAGFTMNGNGILFPTNWMEIIFNPSFPYRLAHMVTATYLTTAFVVAGVAAWYLLHKRHTNHARAMFLMAMLIAIFVAPLQIFIGDLHGLNTLKHQPAKVAAIEGLWETESRAPLKLFGIPDEEKEETLHAIEIPALGSLILTHDINGEIKGLKEWSKEDRPPVKIVFFSFRVMVGIGLLMVLTGFMALLLFLRKRLYNTRWFLRWCMIMAPSGFIALLAGWFVTEIGRQPYIIYGVMRTSQAVTPLEGSTVLLSLSAFIIVYFFVFGSGVYYIFKLIRKGPITSEQEETYGAHGLKQPAIIEATHV